MERSCCEKFDRCVLSPACAWTAFRDNEADRAVARVLEVDQDHPVQFGGVLVVDPVASRRGRVQSEVDDSTSIIALQALEDWEVGIVDRAGGPSIHAIARVVEEVVTDVSFASVEVSG